jgi:hypothetical protein
VFASGRDKTIDVKQFIRTLACFRPVKPETNKTKREVRVEEGVSEAVSHCQPNSRRAKLQCMYKPFFFWKKYIFSI